MNELSKTRWYGKDPTQRKISGRRRAAMIGSAALAASAVTALPADATVMGDSLETGDNITVFHNIDFVAVSGWAAGANITVTVERNGVQIGTATGAASDPEATGSSGLEVNHGPEGTPVAGDCWEGGTPDIQPGDVVTVTDGTDTDQVRVDNIRFTGAPFLADGGDVLVPFIARFANGAAIPLAKLDSPEFRAGSDLRFEATDIRVQRAGRPGEYVMRYNAPFRPSRNRENVTQTRMRRLLLGDGHAIGFGHTDPVPLEAMLHDGLGDTPGPAPGCPGGSNSWGVNAVTPTSLNLKNQARNLTVRGVATGATAVTAQLRDRDGTVVTKPATLSGASWSASFRPAEMTALNGNITVSGRYTLPEGVITGGIETITKDLVAPRAPRASLRSGTYRRPRLVRLRSAAANTIRYTLGRRQARPTANRGQVYNRAIRISAGQTLKAVAVDAAGNVSPLTVRRYRIR